jgi:TonB family protein
MFSDKVFQIAFLISVITHGVILFQNPNFNHLPASKKEQKLEVSYIKSAQESKTELKTQSPAKKEPFLNLSSKITADRRIPPPFIDKESIFKPKSAIANRPVGFAKPAFIRPDIIAIKKKITLPPIDMDKINNPTYISYYQIVREKIKRAAYQNYTGREIGEVRISFVISDEGYLKELRLIEDKSSPSVYLREIALRSIKDASPFPNFPKELTYPHLSFNLAITFEIE